MKIIFKESGAKSLKKLDFSIRLRILEKLRFYASQENPLQFAERLKDKRFGEWRFRIGDYRVLFDLKNNKIIILKVGHRKDIYK
jgi:mRNA interferase RelE/StbE